MDQQMVAFRLIPEDDRAEGQTRRMSKWQCEMRTAREIFQVFSSRGSSLSFFITTGEPLFLPCKQRVCQSSGGGMGYKKSSCVIDGLIECGLNV